MIAKKLVIAGVSVAAVLGGAAVVLDQMAGAPDVSPGTSSSTAAPGPAGAGGSEPPGVPPAATLATPGTAAGGGDGTVPGSGESPGSKAPGSGVREVLPPVAAAPSGLPKQSPPVALVSRPLPPTASAQGKIVAGFPEASLPFPDGTVVVSTAVSAADSVLQVTADAISGASQDSVMGHFQQQLAPLSFWSEEAPAAEGQRSVRFVRGADSVTLTTSTTGTGSTRFMLLGNLHTAEG
ncbi:hypothetical protein [Arthrobacter sp. B10-11]|uniref:hypothetical protein n=1 Tax=Arthrobacter sp. B10-11 TaxID=3081160 RepID=UPI0029546593|nr:hypothetical protein [Arthrobacter sp. B10-11]MDV8146292.1 hypothetical protein [Arthrobacter sp. B10-11]